ncbi:MAG: 30S ribosomal protein S6 [Candidatus Omnitrophota bacterium]|nr:30S ribosomal protein S6 [Candidatus Omnitrophota bacterium]
MGKTDVLNKYELVMILDAKLTADEKQGILNEALDALQKAGGEAINNQIWFEKQRLTFSIKKRNEGTYYMVNFDAPGEAIEKVKPALTLNENILRFAIMRGE